MKAKGFTLVEVLISIAVLTLAFLGPLSVATSALSNASFSINQIIAYNLAEEGMEFIIYKRDSMIFADPVGGWDAFRSLTQGAGCQKGGGTNGCGVDVVAGTLVPCSPAAYPNPNCTLHKNAATGLYSLASGDPASVFERTIAIPSGNSDEKQVLVTITWREKNGNLRTFTLERNVYNRR